MKQEKKKANRHIDVSPVASYEVQRATQSANLFLAIYDAIRSGFSPGPNRPKTWYGRAFLFFGTILVLLVIAAVIWVQILNIIQRTRH